MFPPGLEPGTFRVLGERDNHYTTETGAGGMRPATPLQVRNLRLQAQLRLMLQCSDERGASLI